MAEGYGGIVGWWRAHIVANVTSQTTTTAVIHIDARINCPNAGYNVIGQFHCSIDCDGANRFNRQWMPSVSVPGPGDTTYASVDVTVSKTTAARGVGCSCTLTFPNTTPPQLTGTSSASCTVQIGAGIQPPDPPRNVAFTYVSDRVFRLTWQSSSTSIKPWQTILIDRTDASAGGANGPWHNGATLGASATSNDQAVLPNEMHWFAIYARNGAGDSSHVTSGPFYTTPNAPAVSVSRSGESGVLTIDASKTFAHRIQIQRRVDNGEWTDVTVITLPSSRKTTYTDANRSGIVQWRVRCIRPVYGDDMSRTVLYSSWTTTATIAFSYYPWSRCLSGQYQSCNRSGGYVQKRSSGSYIARQNDTTSGDTVFIRQNNTYVQSPKTGKE